MSLLGEIKVLFVKNKDKNVALTPTYKEGEEVMEVLQQCDRCKNFSKKMTYIFDDYRLCDFCKKSFEDWECKNERN